VEEKKNGEKEKERKTEEMTEIRQVIFRQL
jgi:hypothetical protein